ncbi:MAG: type I-G CRISPR-associated protein Csb2, partial [Acidimicrobiales bacterium]
MVFSVVAEFPLGTYRAHVGDADIDLAPSVARLHAALMCTAASGPRAHLSGDELAADPADLDALRWVETHPPDAVALPGVILNRPSTKAFRELGLVGTVAHHRVLRKLGRPATASVAVEGTFAWVWDEPPPPEVTDVLEALCPDVSHLGTAESPVRLRVEPAVVTHRR